MYPNPTLTPTEKPLTNFEQLVHEKIPTFEEMFDEQFNTGWPSLVKDEPTLAHQRFKHTPVPLLNHYIAITYTKTYKH